MSDLLDEEVPRVAPLSMAMIEELGRCFLEQLAPQTLITPQSLDVCELIDVSLPKFGIHVSPASATELGNREAATTVPDDKEDIEILVSEAVWGSVGLDSPSANYARSTICHEIGHAVIHIPALKRRVLSQLTLARTKRKQLKAYEDPEWQAFAFSGAILMPTVTLKMVHNHSGLSAQKVAGIYKVSEPMAANHLKRLKWLK